MRPQLDMSEQASTRFLFNLAAGARLSASTQKQAPNAKT